MTIKVRMFAFLFIPLVSACMTHRNRVAPLAYQYELNEAEQLIKGNHPAQAIDELQMLIQMDPDNGKALFLLGLAYQKLNRHEDAASSYEAVVKKSPKNSKAHYNLAMLYAYQLGQKKQAVEHFDRFLTLEPYHAEAFNVAKIMVQLDRMNGDSLGPPAELEGKINSGRAALLESVKAFPESPLFYFLIGQTYEEEGVDKSRFIKAAEYYQMALNKKPTCVPCQLRLGQVLAKLGRGDEAKIHIRKAELFSPNSKLGRAKN